MNDYRPTFKPSTNPQIKVLRGSGMYQSKSLTNWFEEDAPVSQKKEIDLLRSFADVELRNGHIFKGRDAFILGLCLIAASYALYTHINLFSGALTIERCCFITLFFVPTLLGLLCLNFARETLAKNLAIKRNSGRRARSEAEFRGSNLTAVNQSQMHSFRQIFNFLVGSTILVPFICLGLSHAFSTAVYNDGLAIFTGLGLLWFFLALGVTIYKVMVGMTSRSIELTFGNFPLELGQRISLTLSAEEKFQDLNIDRVKLRCISEENVLHLVAQNGASNNNSLSRRAVQLYAETRELSSSERQTKKVSFDFTLPYDIIFNTNLFDPQPTYWCLTVDGKSGKIPLKASFILPIYGQ
jgi:hypothetical protein